MADDGDQSGLRVQSVNRTLNNNMKSESMMNGTAHLVNGKSTSHEDDRSESSSTSSTANLTNGSLRSLPPVPRTKDAVPPPLPANPPRSTERLPPRIRTSRPPSGTTKFIPEQEITIPSDGNLQGFSVEDMATFFRHMGIEERIVCHMVSKTVDGKRFNRFKDSELESLGLKNPIIVHFRDKGSKKKKVPFML